MDINELVKEIKKNIKIIGILEKKYELKPNRDIDDPLLYCGVAKSNLISELTPLVEEYFGKAYKPAGDSALFMNLFDKFIKHVGGIRKEQTLYKKNITDNVILYCAFWPWGTEPVKTSVRIGLICYNSKEEEELTRYLKSFF